MSTLVAHFVSLPETEELSGGGRLVCVCVCVGGGGEGVQQTVLTKKKSLEVSSKLLAALQQWLKTAC